MELFKDKGIVKSEWLDYNGHMNVGYYGVAMDDMSNGYFEHLKIGEDYRTSTNNSYFTVESHITYQAEMLDAEEFEAVCGLLDFDAKRLHFFVALYKMDGTLSATAEWMHLHMDMDERKVAPFPEDRLAYFQEILDNERAIGIPAEVQKVVGKSIGIKRK